MKVDMHAMKSWFYPVQGLKLRIATFLRTYLYFQEVITYEHICDFDATYFVYLLQPPFRNLRQPFFFAEKFGKNQSSQNNQATYMVLAILQPRRQQSTHTYWKLQLWWELFSNHVILNLTPTHYRAQKVHQTVDDCGFPAKWLLLLAYTTKVVS